ncbi:D-alanyl-D-alanine carboxypeptidase family protein [Actinomadura parmotrematis]|uniref:D-alanyl-D-alanine carboxypeptidase n=1 Tax=Actinomadura parmotrematis TaxID=2864039 RepID=A0ABS7G5X8_9ACTN|nr:serine hydrolase [Actinomadura parmotrematis]MBW8487043.1 D-alanyl-D-alanine carboxypeptidase [Actinomadura parmotrematis]
MRILLGAAVALLLPLSLAVPARAAPGTAAARPAARPAARGPAGVRALSAYLVDDGTGRALWSRQAAARRPIGSITKVMTAVVVLRAGGLDRRIRVAPSDAAYAAARHGSTARLRAGDRVPARELLAALLLPSGCDAAAALARRYGPGPRRFVAKMNRMAARLGMRRTRYGDVAGLPPAPGASTARDQVVLGRYAMRFPEFRALVKQRRHVLPAGHGHGRYVWRSTDELLGDYPGMLGIKSGHTGAAGYSFLFAARRSGRTLVGAVLNSSTTRRYARFRDAARLLDWGFHH